LNENEKNEKAKEFSNNAQYIIAILGDVVSKVLIFISMKMDNKTGEFHYSNEKIAQNIGHHYVSVSKAIKEIEKAGFINCSYDFNGTSRPRTITWARNYDWNDISDLYLANELRVSQKAKGVLNNPLNTLSENAKDPKPNDLDINTSINTSINNSFNNEKEKYKKNNLEKIKNE